VPTRTLSIWKDKVKVVYRETPRTLRKILQRLVILSEVKDCFLGALCVSAVITFVHFLRPQKHLHLGRVLTLFLFLPVCVRRADKRLKQRMRLQRLRLELRMKLASDE